MMKIHIYLKCIFILMAICLLQNFFVCAEDSNVEAEFEGKYRVGSTTCKIVPVKMGYEIYWEKGSGVMRFFYSDTTSQGEVIFISEDFKDGNDRFVFKDDSLIQGKFIRRDGKVSPVRKESIIWEKVDSLNRELHGLRTILSANKLQELLRKAVELSDYKNLGSEFEKLRETAFETDNFTEINQYVKRAEPAITVVVGGEADYIRPNLSFFLSKSKPKSLEHSFFSLAMYGWSIKNSSDTFITYGGKNNLCDWYQSEDGVTLSGYDLRLIDQLLSKWRGLKPRLYGYYLKIANDTIECLVNDKKKAKK